MADSLYYSKFRESCREGCLYQVESPMEAVGNDGSAIGILAKDGVVLIGGSSSGVVAAGAGSAQEGEGGGGAGINLNVNPVEEVDKRTTLTYIDGNGEWHRVSKGAPKHILDTCNERAYLGKSVHSAIDKYAEHWLRPLAVARHIVPEKTKESSGVKLDIRNRA